MFAIEFEVFTILGIFKNLCSVSKMKKKEWNFEVLIPSFDISAMQ